MNNLTLREAILRAADAFDANPQRFDYFVVITPTEDSKACYVGQIAYQRGIESGVFCGSSIFDPEQSIPLIGIPFDEFYRRMSRLSVEAGIFSWNCPGSHNGPLLRLYADKYHPAKPIAYPDWQAMSRERTVSESAPCEGVAT